MSRDELCFQSASELARRIASREISPVDLVKAVLERADRLEPAINAFVEINRDAALAEAGAAEKAVMAGSSLGVLHGVPISVKDNIKIKGRPMRSGSLSTANVVPTEDAAVITRVRKAGAIIIGKTALPEFAHKMFTDSALHGITRNPWNLGRTPGGSSGGASAALAGGIAPLAIGTDGGGSIRGPAAWAGVAGLKATLGRIPLEANSDAFSKFAFVGPMTRKVEDLALLGRVMSGEHCYDPYSLASLEPITSAKADGAAKGLRVGWIEHFGPYRTDAEVGKITRAALSSLEQQGAIVDELRDPCFDDVYSIYTVLASSAQAARIGPLVERWGNTMDRSLTLRIERGNSYSSVDYLQAQERRTALFLAVQKLFERYDVIATPTVPVAAPPVEVSKSLDANSTADWGGALYPFNLTGHPGISIPVGLASGLPVGLQLVGPWYAEQRLLDVSALLEMSHPPLGMPIAIRDL